MIPEYGFILAGGFGSRMGAIGEMLPKPLWPFFEMKLIDIQRLILQSMGIRKIVVNAHHGCEQLYDYLRNETDVFLLRESEILGTGGAIDNAAFEFGWNDIEILIANSDFFILDPLSDVRKKIQSKLAVEAEMVVFKNATSRYSSLIVDSDFNLNDLSKENKQRERISYSGYSKIRVAKINKKIQKSSIFDNYLNYQKKKIHCHLVENLTYLDLGEKGLFASSVYQLHEDFKKNRSSVMLKRLTENKIIDPSKFSSEGYADEGAGVFNFTGKKLKGNFPARSIILSEGQAPTNNNPSLCFNNTFDSIDL